MQGQDVRLDEPLLQWAEYGGEGEICLLIHGFGDGAFVWHDFAEQLGDWFRVIAVDLRGHGDSEWSLHGKYDFDTHTSDIVRLCERLKLRRVTVIGHSMGGGIAIRVVNRIPEIVRALVLVDYGPFVDLASERATQHIKDRFTLAHRSYDSPEDYVEVLKSERPLVGESLLRRIAIQSLRVRADAPGYQLKRDPAMLTDFDKRRNGAVDGTPIWDRLEQTVCPTLIVRGEVSAVLPPLMARKMASTLRCGQFVEVPQAGHGVMLDNPPGFMNAVESFIVSTSAASVDLGGRRNRVMAETMEHVENGAEEISAV